MKKILIYLRILQVKSIKDEWDVLGKRYADVYRVNPYNPFSYIILLIMTIIGILWFGIIGWWDELGNPFEWN